MVAVLIQMKADFSEVEEKWKVDISKL